MHRGSIAAYLAAFTVMAVAAAARAGDSSCASCALTGDLVFYVDDDAPPFNPSLTWLYYANDITRPVPEIGDARDLIRNYRNLCGKTGEDLDRNVIVYIREGRYAPDTNNQGFPVTLEFESQDSGSVTNGKTITYQAYDGGSGPESVLISGGVVLDNWPTSSPSGGNRWWTQKLPSGWATADYLDPIKPRDLYVDNVRATRAREPDISDSPSTQGFARVFGPIFKVPNPDINGSQTQKWGNEYALDVSYLFPANAGSAARGYTPYRGIECVMRNQGAWASHRQYVREINPGQTAPGRTYVRLHDMIGIQDTVVSSMNPDSALGQHVYVDTSTCSYATEIYLENAKEFMDEPYEWWFNPGGSGDINPTYATDRMWVILPEDRVPVGPHSETPNVQIVVPYAKELFRFHGCSNIDLQNLNFAHTNQDLPVPLSFSQVANGSRVTEVIPSGSGSYLFDVVSKSSADPAKVDHPVMGWFETMRGMPFYQAATQRCAIADQNSIDNLEEENRFRLVPAVRVTGGLGLDIMRCRFAHTGSTGVLIENGHGHSIQESEFFDIGGSAVVVCRANLRTNNCPATAPLDGITAVPTNYTISRNYIYDTGRTYLSSPAIFSGWTATNAIPVPPLTFSQISSNYIMNTPAEAIFSGFGPNDSQKRAQTRHVDIKDNIVRNANQLLDDMAGIVTMRDGDGSGVLRNVVFQDAASTGNARHGLYTDGKSVFGMTGTPGAIIGPPSGWTYAENVVWGFDSPFQMNTAHTCPEHNTWIDNFIEDADSRWLVCATCANPPTTPCTVIVLGQFDFECGNGAIIQNLYFDFDFFQDRYQISPGLSDPLTRSGAAQLIVDGAGPGPSGGGTPADFLYLEFEPLIHPAAATNRTPPSP